MKITKVYIKIYENKDLRAFADVELDKCFMVKGVRVLEKDGDLYLSWPARPAKPGAKDGKNYYDICFPTTKEFREECCTEVVRRYKEVVSGNSKSEGNSTGRPTGAKGGKNAQDIFS